MKKALLNAVYSKGTMRRRYEVWFVRLGLADGSGAWWFRYLLMNPGRPPGGGCADDVRGAPAQVWATWFPRGGAPRSFIQGFSQEELSLSVRGRSPFHMAIGDNCIGENSCAGSLNAKGARIRWDLRYRSTAAFTLSDKGWIGFSRTPHSDAVFSGEIEFDGQVWRGDPLGYGVQGHNCGFRHRHLWNWAHCLVADTGGGFSTFEALEYEMPLGLRFRKAVLWHGGEAHVFRKPETIRRDRANLQWALRCAGKRDGLALTATFDGGGGSAHRLPYVKTDCSGTFEVSNNSLARTVLEITWPGRPPVELQTDAGAVVEMVGA